MKKINVIIDIDPGIDDASHIHGESGMGGYDFPEPTRTILDKHSIEAMKEVIKFRACLVDLFKNMNV